MQLKRIRSYKDLILCEHVELIMNLQTQQFIYHIDTNNSF